MGSGFGRDGSGVRYITRISDIPQLAEGEKSQLAAVERKFVFRTTDYYLGLIDWTDPADPIRKIIVPRWEELLDWGRLDASDEAANTPVRGLQHKYPDTALLLCNEVCGAYCRYCFRKRLFMDGNDEADIDVRPGLDYIARHPEITNVLVTGGDPLLMSPRRILEILGWIRDIPHVRIIRIGTKMPAFNPWIILDRPELVEGLARLSRPDRRIYMMLHFDHPRELTEPVAEAIDMLLRAGLICANQCPIIRGVNDDREALTELFRRLSFMGCPPYYLFQGRPTQGNEPYETPLVRGYRIFEEARRSVSGLAARARMCMSHATGKIEMLGVDDRRIYARYHRARNPGHAGRFMIFERDDRAFWLDQLVPVRAPRGIGDVGDGDGLDDAPLETATTLDH